ncbi:MAG TPA: hypothetical protein VN032_08465, partial [Thermoanaerobaculia bacterium]|nr:hypothetical protein [Thermoanaerobaculia bacterium]
WIVPREQMLGLLLGLPLRVGSLLLPTRLGPALALAATAGGLAIFALARKRWLRVPAVILSVAVLGPLLAVSRALEPRFCALPWLILSVLCCQGWLLLADERRTARIAGSCALAVVLGSAFWSNRLEWRRGYTVAERMSEEGRAFLAMGSGDVLRRPAIPPGAMKQTVWLKSRLGRAPGAGWFGDDVYLCLRPPGERLWEYRERSGGVVRLSEGEVAAARAYCNRIRGAAPLAAHFEARGGTLTWLLGPYSDGRYSLVLDQGVEAFPVRPNDGYQTQPEQLVVMLRYESPEGWVTYSPQLSIDFRAKSSFDWTRP